MGGPVSLVGSCLSVVKKLHVRGVHTSHWTVQAFGLKRSCVCEIVTLRATVYRIICAKSAVSCQLDFCVVSKSERENQIDWWTDV